MISYEVACHWCGTLHPEDSPDVRYVSGVWECADPAECLSHKGDAR